jgi:hypothetical protein
MKKALIILLSLICFAAAQERQKVAVYMAGEESKEIQGMHKIIGAELAKAISGSGKFSAIDRTAQILAQLSSEHKFQRSGAVDDKQIAALGKQFGIEYLCIAEITTIKGGAHYVDVRLVNGVTAENAAMATAHSADLWDVREMVGISRQLAQELIGARKPETVSLPEAPKENVAVCVVGAELRTSQGMHKIIGSELAKAISRGGKYSAVDRTAQIVSQLGKEAQYQLSGAVNERHIKSLGRQLGAQYLCVAEITAISGGSYYMDVRLVDVVTAENMNVVTEHSQTDSWNIHEMVRISQKVSREFAGEPEVLAAELPAAEEEQGALPPEALMPVLSLPDSAGAAGAKARKNKFGGRLVFSYICPEALRVSGGSSELKVDGVGGTLGFAMAFPIGAGEVAVVPEINLDVKLVRLNLSDENQNGSGESGEAVEYFLAIPVLIRYAPARYYLEGGFQAEFPINSDSELFGEERMQSKAGFVCGVGAVMGSRESTAAYLGARAIINLIKFGGDERFSPSAKFALGLSLLF